MNSDRALHGILAAVVMGASLASLPSTARGANAAGEARVDVLAFGCDFAGAKTVNVYMLNVSVFGPNGRDLHVPAMQTANGGLRFSFTAPPGPIYINYSVDGQKCMTGGLGLIVLPWHDRHVLISMQEGSFIKDWHARKFVAGTLPGLPVGLSVVASTSPNCPPDLALRQLRPWSTSPDAAAVIDDGAYYISYVWGAHMFLKLTSGFDTLYIALPDATPVGSNEEYVRRDITEPDLRQLTTHGLNEEVRCIQTPSGTPTRFP